jgi:aryl-alcohol dehydrogenase-like predicted oxidoreductase
MRTELSRRNFITNLADAPKLEYGKLGRTGLKVTRVGFGCMITSDASVIARAIDMGINYIDTARVYSRGNNERMVGSAIKGNRQKIVLSSKVISRTKDAALADLDTSLKELGTDHLDIWYLHNFRDPADIKDELIEAQDIAKKQGKIRFPGISTHANQAAIIKAAIDKNKFDVILTSYNFAMDKGLEPSLDAAHKAGIGVVAMKVMAGGSKFQGFYPTEETLRNKMKGPGAMLAALKWVLKNPSVDTTIPSMVDTDQLEENIRAMGARFTPEDDKVLSARLEQIRPLYCRMCGQREGKCAQGLPVADVLRFLTYAEGYGQFAVGREYYQDLPAEHAAARCNACPVCTVNCPNGVKVAQRMRRAQELFA